MAVCLGHKILLVGSLKQELDELLEFDVISKG